MAEDETEGTSGAGERPKRPPPTIDLEPSEVSGDTQARAEAEGSPRGTPRWNMQAARFARAGLRIALPAASGAVAALIVVAVLWALGVLPLQSSSPMLAQPSRSDEFAARLQDIERRLAQPSSGNDAEARGRLAQLDGTVNALRGDASALRQQIEDLRSALAGSSTAPGGADLSALSERIARLEQSVAAVPGQMRSATNSAEKSDTALRRLVIAALLDEKVRGGGPFDDVLPAAKTLAGDAPSLAPLDRYAAAGVPTDAVLAKDLRALLPQLAPEPAQATPAATSSGVIDRLLAGGAKLVRIERAETPEAAAPSSAALADAARTGDIARAKSELARQGETIRVGAQRWSEAVAARDAALSASANFLKQALAALSQ